MQSCTVTASMSTELLTLLLILQLSSETCQPKETHVNKCKWDMTQLGSGTQNTEK